MSPVPPRPSPSIYIPEMSNMSTTACPASSSSTSSTCFSPSTPTRAGPMNREIIMGGLVSRTPRGDEEEGFDFEEPRRQGSIEVPGIVLTEPLPDLPPRTPSPPPKSILLLPPASLPIPSEKTIASHRTFSPGFASLMGGRSQGSIGTTLRSVLLLGALCLGAWHLYTSLDMSTLVEDAAGH